MSLWCATASTPNSSSTLPPVDQSLLKIIGIGSLSPVKRWDRLLRAASLLKQRNIEFLVQLVGDGPLRERLETQARDLGVTDRVEFAGRREEIPALLSQAAILAHTSENEGCPNVVMEAMACGRPVVAMQAGDISALVDEGKTGFIVDGDDAESFAERIASLAGDRALCRRMGEAGTRESRKRVWFDSFARSYVRSLSRRGLATLQLISLP